MNTNSTFQNKSIFTYFRISVRRSGNYMHAQHGTSGPMWHKEVEVSGLTMRECGLERILLIAGRRSLLTVIHPRLGAVALLVRHILVDGCSLLVQQTCARGQPHTEEQAGEVIGMARQLFWLACVDGDWLVMILTVKRFGYGYFVTKAFQTFLFVFYFWSER